MSSYDARLRIPGQTKVPVGIIVDISEEGLALKSGEKVIAEWPHDALNTTVVDDGFHIKVDGEELILTVEDVKAFATDLGVPLPRPKPTAQPPTKVSLDRNAIEEQRFEELNQKADDVEACLSSANVDPSAAFRKWLRLLKDVNRRHGQGTLPTHQFYVLNTRLLDMIPEPDRAPAVVG